MTVAEHRPQPDAVADGISLEALVDEITTRFDNVMPQRTWGELTFFYNPGQVLKRGTYVCTIKDKDGENDRASNLDRDGVYRLNFCLPRPDYFERFGHPPERPGKGGVVEGGWEFTKLDQLLPHPVYAWMGWVSVLNPTDQTLRTLLPLLELSYAKAVRGFEQRLRKTDRMAGLPIP